MTLVTYMCDEEPEWPEVKSYKVNRPCLWFAKSQIVTVDKISKFLTPQAIDSLIQHEYLTPLYHD